VSFNTATGRIAGVPEESGRFQVVVRAVNPAGADALPLTIRVAPVLDNQVAVVSRGQPLDYRITAADSVSTYAADAPFPAGVTFDAAAGVIRGTPEVSGLFEIPISITNDGGTCTATLTLKVRPLPDGVTERSGSTGQPLAPFRINSPDTVASFGANNLPPGININSRTGVIFGTPTVSGTFDSFISVTNDAGTGTTALRFVIEAILGIAVNGDGSIPSAFMGDSLHLAGVPLSVTATPAPGYFFAGWTGGETSSEQTLNFTMRDGLRLQANFVPFAQTKGTYTGLALSDPRTPATVGFVKLTLTPTGVTTGSLSAQGKTYPLSKGSFQSSGIFTGQFARAGKTPIDTTLRLRSLPGEAQITGTAKTDGTELAVTIDQAVFNAKTNRALQQGNYTVKLERPAADPSAPQGHGYGTVKITAAGAIRLAGKLGDGTAITNAATLSGRGKWPLFVPLSAGKGVIAGEVTIRQRAEVSNLDGSLAWIVPPARRLTAPVPVCEVDIVGSQYIPPAIDYTQTTISFGEGSLASPLGPVTLDFDSRGRLRPNPAPERVKLTLTSTTGLFAGSFFAPGATKATPFAGALLQQSGTGAGFFKGPGGVAGFVELKPGP
jgi:uncharacterized repeat protein (TIGR02543 family)